MLLLSMVQLEETLLLNAKIGIARKCIVCIVVWIGKSMTKMTVKRMATRRFENPRNIPYVVDNHSLRRFPLE